MLWVIGQCIMWLSNCYVDKWKIIFDSLYIDFINDNIQGWVYIKVRTVGYTNLHSLYKLDMSTARRRLKSPQSLYGTSTHLTTVTHRSQSWSWMIDSQPFLSMSISASTPIPQIRLFQTLTFKLQGRGHGCGQRARAYRVGCCFWLNLKPYLTYFCLISDLVKLSVKSACCLRNLSHLY